MDSLCQTEAENTYNDTVTMDSSYHMEAEDTYKYV